ncbi:hypothetical protein PBY51_022011 [Eleginops maclovinus]|uniref:M-phase-specific PLK1-interacting protein n=1 Tax=Eleginops maclovinus TaxID=56733 RepID=A0AAN8AF78_ELEMC|nr:hypothetical protein PBY51_022011 [Eleginops maclovinus]
MHRAQDRPQQSPVALRPAGRSPSPASGWSGSPYGGSPRPHYSPSSPVCSPGYSDSSGSYRGYRDGPQGFRGSPVGFGYRGFGGSQAGFGGRSRGGGFRRPQGFSPAHNLQGDSVERYFNPSMLQDPWAALITDRNLQIKNN